MGITVDSQYHAHGKFCHRFRRIAGHPQNRDLVLSRLDIHVIEACAAKQNRPDLHLVQLLYHPGIHIVIDKDAYCVKSSCQADRLLLKRYLIEMNRKPVLLTHGFKPYFIIWLRTEKSYFHANCLLLPFLYSMVREGKIMHYPYITVSDF